MTPEERPLVNHAGLERLGEGFMHVAAGDHRYEVKVGTEGVRVYMEGKLIGRSGWAAFMSFMAHQQHRLDSLIGDRRVPGTLLDHPNFTTEVLPYLYVNPYGGDRLARGGTRRRVEVRVPTVQEADRLMAIEIACANPICLHSVRPFRARVKGNPLRLFVGFTCPIEESIACARTSGAKEAMEAVVGVVERAGQISINDVRRS